MNFFKKFNKLQVKYKDKSITAVPLFLAVVGILCVCIGSSYAYLTYVAYANNTNKIVAGTLELSFVNGGETISLINAVPQDDNVALAKNKEYTFNIKNSGSISAYYELSLINSCSTNDNVTINGTSVKPDVCIPTDYIRVGIKKNNGDYVIKNINEDGKILLDSDIINPGVETDKYSLKIWLNKDTPNTYNDKSKKIVFSAKLNLYGEQKYVKKLDNSCLDISDGVISSYNCNYTDIEIPDSLTYETYSYSTNKEELKKYIIDTAYDHNEYDSLEAYLSANNITAADFEAEVNANADEFSNDVANGYDGIENDIKEFTEAGYPNIIVKGKKVIKNIKITEIGSEAFNAKKLTSVIVDKGIEKINGSAFASNPDLNEVTILNNDVVLDGNNIFYNSSVRTVKNANGEFPSQCFSVNSLGELELYHCTGASNIVIPASVNGVLFKVLNSSMSLDGIRNVDFSKATNLTTISGAFTSCNSTYNCKLSVVDLSNNVNLTSISSGSFKNAGVKRLYLPSDGNLKIEGNAFSNNNISELTIPNSVVSLGGFAFKDNNIKILDMSNANKLTELSSEIFANNSLSEVKLPMNGNLQKIGASFINNNSIIKKIVIPSSATSIDGSFHNTAIETLDFSNAVNLTSIGQNSFDSDTSKYKSSIKTIDLSNTKLESVSLNAFKVFPSLERVVLPTTLKTIESGAFPSIQYDLYDTNKNTPLACFTVVDGVITDYKCSYANTLIIPTASVDGTSVTGINTNVLFNAKKIIIPAGITSITGTGFNKSDSKNLALTEIINNTGLEFDWNLLITGTSGDSFATGVVTTFNGNVTIKAS